MIQDRLTLAEDVLFDGLGLHSGQPVRVVVHPGSDGVAFRHGSDRVQAIPKNVTDTSRCTRLGDISTIEHLMSALAALEITDAEVELSAPELPAMDGSAKPFFDGLSQVGLERIGSREARIPFARLFLPDGNRMLAVAAGVGHWRYLYDRGDKWPGQQAFESDLGDYGDSIAPARTIVTTEELDQARQHGLGKGLDESSVLIVGDKGPANEARFPDEIPRHKLLDLIGDLYLAGVPIRALNAVGERTGHKMNIQMAQMLYNAVN